MNGEPSSLAEPAAHVPLRFPCYRTVIDAWPNCTGHRQSAGARDDAAEAEGRDARPDRVEHDRGQHAVARRRPVVSPVRVSVMSTRPAAASTCCANVTAPPPDARNVPSCTSRTRRTFGSKRSDSVTVLTRDAPNTEIGHRGGLARPPSSGAAGGVRMMRSVVRRRLPAAASRRGAAACRRLRPAAPAARPDAPAAACGGRGGCRRRRPAALRRRGRPAARAAPRSRPGRRRASAAGAPSERRRAGGAPAGARRGLARRLDERRRAGEPEVLLRADEDRREVLLRQLVRAHDVRREQHHDVGLDDLLVVRREELLQDRDARRCPGTPLSDLRSFSRSRPASRFDSPSRSRSRVSTLRVKNDGRFCPATFWSGPLALISSVELQDDVAVVGDARLDVEVHADVLVRERRHRVVATPLPPPYGL